MEWFRQLGRALRNLARIAREQPIWAITALVTSPVALIRHLFGVVVLFLITGLVLGLGVPLILGKLLGLPRDSNIYQIGPVGPKLRFWPSRRTFWERGIRY
jgi:type IV secretion system protein VirD4